jgi:hypothetical protein
LFISSPFTVYCKCAKHKCIFINSCSILALNWRTRVDIRIGCVFHSIFPPHYHLIIPHTRALGQKNNVLLLS